MDNASHRGRPNGVMIPRGQTAVPSNAAPGTIIGFQLAETFAIRYVGEDGKEVDDVVLLVGGTWYKSPNGENYANSLRRFSPKSKLAMALDSEYKARIAPKKVPAQDGADVGLDG